MSTAGFEAYNDSGTFSVTDRNPTLGFITKGSVTCPGWGDPSGPTGLGSGVSITPPTGYSAIVMAYRSNGPFLPAEALITFNSTAFKVFGPSSTTVEWFMFARSQKTPASHGSGPGLQIFDSSGRNTFDSSMRPGRVIEVVNLSAASNVYTNQTIYNGASFPSGKSYAAIPRYYADRVYQPSPPTSTVRMYMGVMTCNTNLSVTEYMYLTGPSDTNDHNAWGSGAIMLVDVTGF